MNINVKTSNSDYQIIIKSHSFDLLAEYIKPFAFGGKLFVVTDDNVSSIYEDKLRKVLEGYDFKLVVLPHGEKTKCMASLQKLYSEMASFGMSRSDCLMAFGGGVIGDLAGFAAATFLRGIKYIQVPTTLLSQVDSSVGGKVAIDIDEGKNLVGSFYPPCLVVIDPEFLNTLPRRVFNDGMAEVIKYGAIRDAELFEILEGDISDKLEQIISCCVNIKKQVVENDEFDTGERMILNFGHTFGHVVEKLTGYSTYTHGEGVAIGMLRITQKSEQLGITEQGTADKLRELLQNYDLVFDKFCFDKSQAKATMTLDKKSTKDTIRYVMIEKIGSVVVKEISKDDMFLLED